MNKSKRWSVIAGVIGAIVIVILVGWSLMQNKQANNANQASTEQQSSVQSSKRQTESKDKLNQEPLPQLSEDVTVDEAVVKMQTTVGDIDIKLFPKYAPLAVENFITHAQEGYYNNTSFHRVLKDFMIQGGDPKSAEDPNADDLGAGGKSIWASGMHQNHKIDSGNGFKNEISYSLYNLRGALSMANAGPDTNGSQFFINQNGQDMTSELDASSYPDKIVEAYKKGGNPNLDGNYTVFGQVTAGMEIVDQIANADVTTNQSGESSKPKDPVKINGIQVIQSAATTE